MVQSAPRLGRPVGADGDATRARVLGVARLAFASLGYGATTFRVLADRTGLAPSAIYNYFSSKAALYVAVYQEVQWETYAEWIIPAIAGADTFATQIDALLTAFVEMNVRVPEAARFQAAARVDTARYPELAALRDALPIERQDLFARMVDHGIDTGEVPASARPVALAMLEALSLGLVELSSDPSQHRLAVDGFRRSIAGSLASWESPP